MKLVSMLIAAFSIFFSGVIFAMDIPIYGFVDSPQVVQSLVAIPAQAAIADEEVIIYKAKSLDYADDGRFRHAQYAVFSFDSGDNGRLYWEVGWQLKHSAT